MMRLFRSISVTRPCRSAMTTTPLRSWKWQGRRKPSTKSMCLPASVKRCSRLLRRSATVTFGVAPRVSIQIPCGSFIMPGLGAAPAERAQVLALAIVAIDVVRAVAVRRHTGRRWARWRCWSGCTAALSASGAAASYRCDVRRALDLVDDLPLQRRLDDRRRQGRRRLHARVRGVGGEVEELLVALFLDPQAVRHAAEFLAPRPHELAGAIEDHDRVARSRWWRGPCGGRGCAPARPPRRCGCCPT